MNDEHIVVFESLYSVLWLEVIRPRHLVIHETTASQIFKSRSSFSSSCWIELWSWVIKIRSNNLLPMWILFLALCRPKHSISCRMSCSTACREWPHPHVRAKDLIPIFPWSNSEFWFKWFPFLLQVLDSCLVVKNQVDVKFEKVGHHEWRDERQNKRSQDNTQLEETTRLCHTQVEQLVLLL